MPVLVLECGGVDTIMGTDPSRPEPGDDEIEPVEYGEVGLTAEGGKLHIDVESDDVT